MEGVRWVPWKLRLDLLSRKACVAISYNYLILWLEHCIKRLGNLSQIGTVLQNIKLFKVIFIQYLIAIFCTGSGWKIIWVRNCILLNNCDWGCTLAKKLVSAINIEKRWNYIQNLKNWKKSRFLHLFRLQNKVLLDKHWDSQLLNTIIMSITK